VWHFQAQNSHFCWESGLFDYAGEALAKWVVLANVMIASGTKERRYVRAKMAVQLGQVGLSGPIVAQTHICPCSWTLLPKHLTSGDAFVVFHSKDAKVGWRASNFGEICLVNPQPWAWARRPAPNVGGG
jgi:hypothetical protein